MKRRALNGRLSQGITLSYLQKQEVPCGGEGGGAHNKCDTSEHDPALEINVSKYSA